MKDLVKLSVVITIGDILLVRRYKVSKVLHYNIRAVFYLACIIRRHCAQHFTVSCLILKIIFWVDRVRLSHEIAVFIGQKYKSIGNFIRFSLIASSFYRLNKPHWQGLEASACSEDSDFVLGSPLFFHLSFWLPVCPLPHPIVAGSIFRAQVSVNWGTEEMTYPEA